MPNASVERVFPPGLSMLREPVDATQALRDRFGFADLPAMAPLAGSPMCCNATGRFALTV